MPVWCFDFGAPMRPVSRCLAAAIVALSLAACDDPAEKEAKYLQRGKALYSEGDRVKAHIEFKNVLQTNPRSVDAHYYIALISEAEGDLRSAFGSFHRVIEVQPGHVVARVRLATLYFFAEALEQAAEHADAALALEPRHADALSLRAAIALRQERSADARQGAEQALAVDPHNLGAISVLTGVHMAAGEVDQALDVLDAAIRAAPRMPLLRLKAEIERSRQDFDELENTYRQMVEVAPAEPDLRAALAQLHLRAGREGQAEKVLRDGIAAAPESWPMKALLVALLIRNGAADAAERELKAFQGNDPANPNYALALAEFHEGRGDLAKAEAQLRVMAEQHPGAPRLRALSDLARLKAHQGDVVEASNLIRLVLSEDPEHTPSLLLRAAMFIEDGSMMNAVTDLRTVLRRRPDKQAALELLSEAHRRRGELDLAVDALRQAAEIAQNDARIRLRLADLLQQQGDPGAARAIIEEVLRHRPNLLAAWTEMTRLSLREGEWDAAAKSIAELEKLPKGAMQARQLRAELLSARGAYGEAAEAYRGLLMDTEEANGPLLSAFATASLEAGQVSEAAKALEPVVSDQPAGWLALGRLYLAEHRRDAAHAAFDKAIALAPHRAEGYLHLAELLSAGGDVDGAEAVLRRGLDAGAGRLPLLFMLALTEERAGRFEQAYQTYEQLLRHEPDSELAVNNLVSLIASRFHKDPARLERALGLSKRLQGSRNPLIIDTVAWLSFRAGDVDTAARLLDGIKDVEHGEIRYHRGAVLMAQGRLDEARQELSAAVDGKAVFAGRDEAIRLLAQ